MTVAVAFAVLMTVLRDVVITGVGCRTDVDMLEVIVVVDIVDSGAGAEGLDSGTGDDGAEEAA